METFKQIDGYPDYYIGSQGTVKSYKWNKEHILKPQKHYRGYLTVNLRTKEGKDRTVYIHRLVAAAFLSNPLNLPEVNHKDENKQNNSVSNLEYCDRLYNVRYGTGIQRSAEAHDKLHLGVSIKKDPKGYYHAQNLIPYKNKVTGEVITYCALRSRIHRGSTSYNQWEKYDL